MSFLAVGCPGVHHGLQASVGRQGGERLHKDLTAVLVRQLYTGLNTIGAAALVVPFRQRKREIFHADKDCSALARVEPIPSAQH